MLHHERIQQLFFGKGTKLEQQRLQDRRLAPPH
jgi:hypothetical protein